MKTKIPCRKKKWKDLQIIRVKLNPEQAVLACCSVALGKIQINAWQCGTGCATEYGAVSS